MVDFNKLAAPFPPDRVSWRIGSTTQDKKRGMALAYFDARDAMTRLDEICGPGGWQCTYPHANGKTVCSIGIKVGDEWVWKADGAGDTDVEAEKGALSDAFKRAAVRWGIGRYLYDAGSPWVEIEPAGKSYRIKDSEMARLAKSLGGVYVPRPPSPDEEISPAESAAINAVNACTSRAEIIALLNREVEQLKALPDGGGERVKLRANERLQAEFPKVKEPV